MTWLHHQNPADLILWVGIIIVAILVGFQIAAIRKRRRPAPVPPSPPSRDAEVRRLAGLMTAYLDAGKRSERIRAFDALGTALNETTIQENLAAQAMLWRAGRLQTTGRPVNFRDPRYREGRITQPARPGRG